MALSSSNTRIVASAAPASRAEALALRVPASADVLEIRLDAFLEPPDLPALRAAFAGRTLLATLRSAREGGSFTGGPEEAGAVLSAALAAGFDLVDVELVVARGRRLLGLPPERVVVSVHDLSEAPDLEGWARELAAARAAFSKLVTRAANETEARAVLDLQERHGRQLTAFAMGEFGIVSRVLSPFLGAPLAFGSIGPPTAPGQLSAVDLREIYGVGTDRRVEQLFALFGGRVSHSFSPALHNARFRSLELPYLYVPCAVKELPKAPRIGGLPLAGASVTVPFKEDAARLAPCEETALNTLLWNGRSVRGVNTDRVPFETFLQPAEPGRIALVLGTGGTARTAIAVLKARGYDVKVASRDPERAAAFAYETGVEATGNAVFRVDVLVNATPLGLSASDPLPCDASLVTAGMTVVDAPYLAGGTALTRLARSRGARLLDGFAFLVSQAAAQSTLFTGVATAPGDLLAALPERIRAIFTEVSAS
ncbi:MAG: type I 3-dehydroquinate dehydratase [Acidobacteria bacterium]|nr:type I 3-dehydroquinate dehydratase [Acidobacteriota bacterium]